MTETVYYIICAVLSLGVLLGIHMMSKVKTAVNGNLLSALCMLVAVVVTLYKYNIFSAPVMWIGLGIGTVIGIILTIKVQMITMPQTVALLNGLGGAASAVAAFLTLTSAGSDANAFILVTGMLALAIGGITFSGSLVAAGKLHKLLPQKPIVLRAHQARTVILFVAMVALIVLSPFGFGRSRVPNMALAQLLVSLVFGVVFAIRVGGADMPITISLLNSTSGVAAAIAGMAVGDLLLVAVGGIVGASGLILTQIMCRAMNRNLSSILFSKSSKPKLTNAQSATIDKHSDEVNANEEMSVGTIGDWIESAKNVIIIPGYGMALSQAQSQVKQLTEKLESMGKNVRFAIHPVAGRMPGHMNVLLAEVDIPYDKLYEMEAINKDFANTDLTIVIGANDVINPAANTAEGTPIYGMPVLEADKSKHIVICNFDLKPGYAGVPNPLYEKNPNRKLLLGDAKESIASIMSEMTANSNASAKTESSATDGENPFGKWCSEAKEVIIIPGYGMALSQAQQQVKQLTEKLEAMGKNVRFAIHPVAGRMPGHMNVLLAEVDIPYDKLYEMEAINDDFAKTDLTIIIGASDVVNPAANTAEGTPIYGMPVLKAEKSKHVVICNFDLKPGYAGVPNPLYEENPNRLMLLGDAKDSIAKLMECVDNASSGSSSNGAKAENQFGNWCKEAKDVIIIPGYGMALSQAQSQVKQLADKFVNDGKKVRFAIHPVAGRMPGHMNVLLAEVNVDYDDLCEMEKINPDFPNADLVIVVGASDVINPAANTAEGTPIYGMPVLAADKAKRLIICNFDLKPGYAGVPNPLYEPNPNIELLLGDAKESLSKIIASF